MTKEESVKEAMLKLEEVLGLVFEQGVESVPAVPAPVEQAPVEIPAPVAVDPNDQAALDEAVAPFKAQIEELKAKLAEGDATPFDQKAIDDAVEKATSELKAEFAKKEDDQDAQQELISQAMKELADRVSALTVKPAPAVEDGAAPAPVEGEEK